jgi:phosphoribosyl-ATP pyrophosphohydrolase/phosphoribosyl-AMP cyclohydrolase
MPVIVQDSETAKILMLGFLNSDALEKTMATGRVTFYSRSKKRLWTKGETSGNYLNVHEILVDCDLDTLLIKAVPTGAVCHAGSDTCFGETNIHANFLFTLENVIKDRRSNPRSGAYTSKLFDKGLDKIAQKVGEEAVELIIEAKNSNDENFRDEAADLLYHFLVLLTARNIEFESVLRTLQRRSKLTE